MESLHVISSFRLVNSNFFFKKRKGATSCISHMTLLPCACCVELNVKLLLFSWRLFGVFINSSFALSNSVTLHVGYQFPFSSYETWIPKILTGLRSHFSCNGLLLLFSNFPNPIAFVFFGLILGPLANQSYQLFLRPVLQRPGQHKKDAYHLHIGSISVRFLIF